MTVRLRGSCKRKHKHSAECMRYYYDFMIRRVRYVESIPEAQTKQEALKVEADARRAVYEGRYGRQMRSMTFELFVKDIFMSYARTNRKRWEQDEKMVNSFVDFFKGKALQDIPPFLIEQWKKQAMKTLTPLETLPKASTVNQKLSVLHRIFSLAVENGYLTQNPASKVKRLREGRGRERVMSYEEETSLRFILAKPRYYNLAIFFELALMTGMRAQEILGLKFSEIDFESAEINLPANRTKEGKEKGIPLNTVALAVLRDQQLEREGMATVFGHGAGYAQIGDLWRDACREAGIVDLHIHDLRHTFASRLLEKGYRETDINRLLGHSKLKMTVKYVHSSEASRREAVESLSQDSGRKEQRVVNLKEI